MQNYHNYKVDLSNCDTEPIHLIGRIQPQGFMLILNKQTLEVEQLSANIGEFLQADPAILPGKKLNAIAFKEEYTTLEERIRLQLDTGTQVDLIELQGKQFFAFLHESQGSLVLECEPYMPVQHGQQILDLTGGYTRFLEKLDQQGTLVSQAQLTTQFVQQVLDYDQVMLYRFDEDWHGEVIAETAKPGVHTYLHHHFPASDIPAQARALLLQKPVRQIANVSATAVDITPYFNPTTGQPSNIIRSELRNPSEIHLQYLQNMGVQATLSISIIVNEKLWGIIACQHKTALFTNYWRRQLCLNIAQAFANGVLANEEQRDMRQLEELRVQEVQLMNQLMASRNLQEELQKQQAAVLSLTEASGVALLLDGKCYTYGYTPSEQSLRSLAQWLAEHVGNSTFHTRQLSHVYPAAADMKEQASGLLALEISKLNKEYLLYFKPEISETRIWAGKPDKEVEEQSGRIHPRKSFARWVQVIKGTSLPWSLNEIEVAQTLVKDLVAVVLRNQKEHLLDLNKKLNQTSEMLRAKNRRLEDFTHIITHNLRSPLGNMQGLIDLYNDEPTAETGVQVMHLMDNMVQNMATTLDDLGLILESELSTELEDQEVYLPDLVERELQNLQSIILQTDAKVQLDLQVKHITAPKVYLESITHNLISNALKYRSPERQPLILVKSWQEQEGICFSVQDNGLGINLKRYGHKIFKVYNTFHQNKDAKGLGLYLTKVQAEALGGGISVDSIPGEGTTFKVCLKV
ncbi:ATP-binding protein [Pontibacter chinhatensis]|uniref:histidine kinase n=1 Tax=Pontibacter chinhatensis TaxID=1436961 RepID=A0A1I2XIQ3_9BACT|nr:ATP-binding protein [Pontibacter chinhatensis]SFH13295.1 Bacteriophytochrome (light-regulated signal transduction histidine kinase) [Pontibacter chinhatensis]